MSPLLPILGLAAAAFFVLRKPSPPAQSPEDAANDAYLGMATAHAYLDADADHVSVTAEVVNDAAMIPLLTVLGFKDLGQRMWSLHVPLR